MPNLNELTDLSTKQKTGTQSFLGGQQAGTSDFLKRYGNFIRSQEGTGAMAGRIGKELGIPTLQAGTNLLRSTVANLPSTYSKATTGFDVNANQLSRIIGQKASELAPALETSERSLETAQGNLATRLGYEQYDQARLEKPFGVEQDFMSDRLARETTLFSQENERELDALIAKINAGVTLTEGEKNRANQLSIAEKGFQNELAIEKEKNTGQKPVSTDTGDWMWDSSTSQWVPVFD